MVASCGRAGQNWTQRLLSGLQAGGGSSLTLHIQGLQLGKRPVHAGACPQLCKGSPDTTCGGGGGRVASVLPSSPLARAHLPQALIRKWAHSEGHCQRSDYRTQTAPSWGGRERPGEHQCRHRWTQVGTGEDRWTQVGKGGDRWTQVGTGDDR